MIELSKELEQIVQNEVDQGHFPNRESVLAHAVRLLQQEREEAIHGILLGLEDADAGRLESVGDAFEALRRAASASHPSDDTHRTE